MKLVFWPPFLKGISLFLTFLLTASSIRAQSLPYTGIYAAESNPLYWKNKKPHAAYWQQDVNYTIQAELNDSSETIKGKMVLLYTNNSPASLSTLYFRLYQNAFQPGTDYHNLNIANKVVPQYGKYEQQKLGTVIHKHKVKDFETSSTLDQSIYIINLKNKTVAPGETIEIEMEFTTYFDQGSLRRRMKKFEHNGVKHFDGVLWYPRICVYDHKFGWHTDQHLSKEFYGDYGSYSVELTLPNNYIVEATGSLLNNAEAMPESLYEKIKIENYKNNTPKNQAYQYSIPRTGKKTWKYYAVNVHDFAWTADPSYRIGKTMYNGIECIALAQEQNAWGWQPTADFVAFIVKTYSEDFGAYAYPKMVAADARDGMEYPMITLNGGEWPGHQYVIAHEIGHNWFYGMLGNNETYRAFMDEGFTQYLTTWSLKKFHKQERLPSAMDDRSIYNGYLSDAINQSDPALNTHSDDFSSAVGKGGGYRHVYYKTATMLANLQYTLGDDLFIKAMQHYVQKWKICHPYPEDFRQAIIEYTGADLNWFFDQWLETTKSIDYAIVKVKRERKNKAYKITFKRNGEMQMPIDFVVTDKKGNKQLYHIPNTYFRKQTSAKVLPQWRGWGELNKTYTATVPAEGRIKNIEIDTSQRLADIYRIDNSYKGIGKIYLNQGIEKPLNFYTYPFGIRPDLWWNSIDGTKVGVNVSANYAKKKHIIDGTFWFNTGIGRNKDLVSDAAFRDVSPWISYSLDYKNLIGKDAWFYYHSRLNDGISMDILGVNKSYGKNKINVFAKAFSSYLIDNPYFFDRKIELGNTFQQKFSSQNYTLNLHYTRNYQYKKGSGMVEIRFRTPSLFTEQFFYKLEIESKQTSNILKSTLRTRFYAATMQSRFSGVRESQIMLAGANDEELLDNKFTRSVGIVPGSMFWNGTSTSNFHMGGGLNLRGYAGYLAPALNSNNQIEYLYFGNSGVSTSAEFDFDNYINFRPKALRWLKVDAYMFADAGILSMQSTGSMGNPGFAAPFRMDAGIGSVWTIRSWGKRNAIKPFSLRFDMPFFLNRPPAGEDYLAFRWLIGIGKSF